MKDAVTVVVSRIRRRGVSDQEIRQGLAEALGDLIKELPVEERAAATRAAFTSIMSTVGVEALGFSDDRVNDE